jgi:hypothetical protein
VDKSNFLVLITLTLSGNIRYNNQERNEAWRMPIFQIKAMSKKPIEHLRHATKRALSVPGRCYAKTSSLRSRTIIPVHNKLEQKYDWYAKWHQHPHHKKVHVTALVAYCLVALFSLGLFKISLAADQNDVWNFGTPSNFTYDSNQVEASGTSARLKAQNYTTDGNTMALYHLDESSGTTADDVSASNNDATTSGSPTWGSGNLNNALSLNGSTQYASAADSASLSLTGSNTLESWTKFANPFSAGSSQYRQSVVDKGKYQFYYDNETGKVTYELENSGSTGWTQQAGYDMLANNGANVKRSWDQNGKQYAYATVKMGSNIYASLGGSTNDAEIWEYNTSSGVWAQIAGDGINSSWDNEISTNAYEAVLSLATNGTDVLYAGLGTGTNDGDVWRFKSGSWSKIGGDGLNSGWAGNSFNGVYSLAVSGDTVWAGLGTGTNMGQVWACTDCDDNPNWNSQRLGGYNGTTKGWAAGYEVAYSLTVVGGNPVVGLGSTAGDGEVWHCTANCTNPSTVTWTKRGGDGTGASGQSWGSAEYILSMASDGNTIYVGTGTTTNTDANVWSCDTSGSCDNTTGWTKLGSSANFGTDKEGVFSITNNGSTLYVGTGSSANGDDEVYRYDGSWTKIGGDNLNSGWNATHNSVRALIVDGTTVYAGLTNTTEAYFWKCTSCSTSPSWGSARIGGNYVNKSWGQYNIDSVESSTTVGGKMYVGTGNNTAGDATVWELDPTTDKWSVVGGQGIESSWAVDTYEAVWSMTNYKNKLYVGLGSTAGEAEVWRFDNPGWTKVADGSPAVGSAWSTTYEYVYSLGVANGKLYAGLGVSAGDGEVWECTGCEGGSPSWGSAAIGGTASGNWGTASYTTVSSMATYKGSLYVGIGNNAAGLAEVWRYSGSGTTWTKVGGDGINSGWANTKYEDAPTLVVWNNKLVVGLGSTGSGTPNNDAEVWACTDCDSSPVWAQIGGDSNGSDNLGWLDAGNYDRVRSMAVYNGDLYAGLGLSTGDGEVWKYNGTTWSQVGGDGLNDSWLDSYVEDVTTMVVYRGKLYVSTGNTANSDAMVWSYGDNGFLQSSTASHDANWHHVAARYNGTTMEILIDGSSVGTTSKTLTMSDGSQELLIGKSHGGFDNGRSQSFFEGSIDEVRISDTNRSTMTTKPYSADPQTINLTTAVRTSGILSWDTFATTETLNGGTIAYRLSDNGGSSWKYWNGSSWATSASLVEASSASVVNTNISSFPVTFSGITWQAVLDGNGDQQVTLDEVDIGSNIDITDPSANASSLAMQKSNGGASVSSNGWTNGASPYFSWTAGADAGAGIKGYCLSLSQTGSDNPITTKGILGTSPVETGGNCQFVVSTTSIDLATSGYLATPLSSSSSPYYLNVRAIDNAGNVFDSSAQFQFRFDNTNPANPGYITAPSGFINTKAATLTWPTGGGTAAQDTHSGVAGLQYRINGGTWYGDTHNGAQDATDLLTNDGSYATVDPTDYDELADGVNTFEFRTWDSAGNYTSSYVTAELKINTSGAPSSPQNVTANPSTNTSNSFAFDWDAPATFVGDVNNITYCYTINATPNAGNCTFTSGGVTSLGASAYATQPGANTFYVVARDESSNINYATYAYATFTANTTAPGIPLNSDIVDVSIKSTSNWRLALTWDPPSTLGSGVASYKVYRSTNDTTFTYVGSSTSTTYIDAGLSQVEYFYRVKACDSTNNCGAESASVSMIPTGKFTSPATLTSDPTVDNITTRRAKISWTTDRNSDSKIAIGTASGEYSPSEMSNSEQATSHEIDLENLAAGTTYYYVAKWTDEDGNTGTSGEQSFTTAPAPTIKEVEAVRIGLNSAAIQFTTRGATQAKVYFGQSEGFGGLKTVNTSTSESSYVADLSDLTDGVKYYYKVNGVDSEGNEYEGSVLTFTTPQKPRIENLALQPVEGEPTSTQKVSWTTNVPATSQVEYGKTGATAKEISDSQLVTEHEVTIRDLEDDSQYTLVAYSRDGSGNLATSEKQVFKTALDTRPPKITDVQVETTIRGVGSEARGQLVVTWKTDEPSTSQVAFGEGASSASFSSMTTEDASQTTEHIVIISDLSTAKVYNVQAVARDKAGNQAKSEGQSTIVGRASDSVLSIIFNTLQKMFGFLGQ